MIINASTDNIQVTTGWDRAPLEEVRRLAEYPVALIGDAQARMNVMSGIRLITPGLRMSGVALPVQTREGDNLALHRALDEARPGDVLVVNGNGDTSRAVFGDILGELCVERGIAGVVLDGATRDVEELSEMGLPVFARAVTPNGPWKDGPGKVGEPVACGHVVCYPGDAVIGDTDGLVVIRGVDVTGMVGKTRAQELVEQKMRANIYRPH